MKILEISTDLDGGGVDRLLFDYCSRMIPDIQFDFIVVSKTEGILEAPLRELGCHVFHIVPLHENMGLHLKQLNKIISKGKYDVVHAHGGYKAVFAMYFAKRNRVKGRIAHAHLAYIPETNMERLIRKAITPITKFLATDLFACGQDAAEWMWGGDNIKPL